jgi:hypothetical protein
MDCHDIVYIQGNPSSGTPLQHSKINKSIIELIEQHDYVVINSEQKNLSNVIIPKAKVYIGFSRGSRYLKKLDNNRLKISIGGVKSSKVHLFKNKEDNILLGDMTEDSMNAHFIISDEDKSKIKSLINNFLSTL